MTRAGKRGEAGEYGDGEGDDGDGDGDSDGDDQGRRVMMGM